MPNRHKGNEARLDIIQYILFKQNRKHLNDIIIGTLQLFNVAPGQSYTHKVALLQVLIVVKAAWGIFKNTNRSLFLFF